MQPKQKTIALPSQTYEALLKIAKSECRTIGGQIDFFVKQHQGNAEVK